MGWLNFGLGRTSNGSSKKKHDGKFFHDGKLCPENEKSPQKEGIFSKNLHRLIFDPFVGFSIDLYEIQTRGKFIHGNIHSLNISCHQFLNPLPGNVVNVNLLNGLIGTFSGFFQVTQSSRLSIARVCSRNAYTSSSEESRGRRSNFLRISVRRF